jgi:hypothetical protein
MARLRHIAVWTLLATLVVGGVAGPVVHRVQHAAERTPETGEACHPAPVHDANAPVWAADTGLEGPSCPLCATRLLVVLPTLAPTAAPRVMGTARVVLRTHLTPAHVATDRTIRGPPSVSGTRPA